MAQETPYHTQTVAGWAAYDSSGKIEPFLFKRRWLISPARFNIPDFNMLFWITVIVTTGCRFIRENGANDVTIKILYCGICHTDLHYARNDWGITMYPVVPGYSNRSRLFNSTVHSILS